MSKTNDFETDVLELVFNNTALTGLGDGGGLAATTPAGSVYAALYTIAPTDSTPGTECNYSTYARVAVARASGAGGWTISSNNASNTSTITFPLAGLGDSETAEAVGVHFLSAGSTLIYWAALDSSLSISNGVQPQFLAGELDINEG